MYLWQKCAAFYHVWLSLFGILTIFPTLLIDDSNNALYVIFSLPVIMLSELHTLVHIVCLQLFWYFPWQYSRAFQHCFVSLIWFLRDIFYYLPYWEWEICFIFLVVLALVSLLFVALFESIAVVMSWTDPSQDQHILARGCFCFNPAG